ncbi:e3 ubiquitin-protein ligase ari5-related [Anaeramoeba flamelloides]|uniref:RBR-type E3 ubiquitin transferase n=1 Tax=Anaeramoeba flamelloides TaxID=1746091 RepID=A0ABQ8XT66_9EUKA|nr:e3 ubiquitin-protein ligase ari5-related [Anaeramoeba flamelloides]
MTEPFVNQFFVQQLVSMGFEKNSAEFALEATGNLSVDSALELLISSIGTSNLGTGGGSQNNTQNNNNTNMVNKNENQTKDVPDFTSETSSDNEEKSKNSRTGTNTEESSNNDSWSKSGESDSWESSEANSEKNSEQENSGISLESSESENQIENDPGFDLFDKEDIVSSKTQAMDEDSIIREQANEIDQISSVLNISTTATGALLRYFCWNKDKLMENMMTNPKKTLQNARIRSDGKVGSINCPSYKCRELVQEDLVKKLVPKQEFKKYLYFIATTFVDGNPNLNWCPNKNCGKVVTSDMVTRGTNVRCSCGHRFCFKCGEESHSPSTCDEVKSWKEKANDDSETRNWILSFTKACPKCKIAIEKNQGCNHMTCKRCRHEFCWICMGNWKAHGGSFYSCNKYKPKTDNNKKKSKAALEKYFHYMSRFENHEKSLKFETELRRRVAKKMYKMQDKENMNYVDVSFMEEAVDQLCECRLILKWTYVFAFYLKKKKSKELFEFVQMGLESTTEKLSNILERPFNRIDKMEAVNTTRIAKLKLEHLFDTVESGLPD